MIRKLARKKHALLAATVLSTLPFAAGGGAEAADSENIQTRDVVVTASRTEQELKETPTAAEVITREELERTGANTLTEALKRSANINVTQSAMGNNVSLRGMNNNQTLILINGRRIRTEDTNDSANKYELNRVNMANVDHIEIIRGAASSLYGSEAMGGVINIITKKDAKESVTFGGDWTTHETDAYFHASTGKIGKWAVDIDGKYSKTRNWGYLGSTAQVISMGGSNTYSMVTQSTNQYGERYFFDIDGRYAIDKDKEWDIFFDYMREDLKSQSMTAHVLNMPPYMNNRTVLTAGYLNLFDHERWTAGTGYKGKDSRGDYELRAYFTEFNKDQKVYYSYYSGNNHNAGDLSSHDDMTFKSFVVDGKRTLQAGDHNLITFGGEYRNEKYDSTRLANGSTSQDYEAVYLQDEWMPDTRWTVIPSVRYDHSGDFGSKVTAKLGSTYKLSRNARLKANFGSAYRAPTASEMYMDWSHSSYAYILGNPDLQPETSLNFDFSIEAEKGRTSGKIGYFRNKVKNLIDYEYIGTTSGLYTYRYYNVNKATIQGIEAEATQKLGDKFSLKAGYAFLDAYNSETDERLANRARHNIKLSLNFDDAKASGVTASLYQDWLLGYRYEIGNEVGDTHLNTLNFVINKDFKNGLSAYFGVDNIFDEQNVNLFADGRVYRFGMKYTF